MTSVISSSSSHRRLVVVTLTLIAALGLQEAKGDANNLKCQSTKLVVYKVTFSTFWDRETFPKQYPEWRPPPQWSKLVGKQTVA